MPVWGLRHRIAQGRVMSASPPEAAELRAVGRTSFPILLASEIAKSTVIQAALFR
jgi:hypothetical protein